MRKFTSIILSVIIILNIICALNITVLAESEEVMYIGTPQQLLDLDEKNISGATYVLSSNINLNNSSCVLSNGNYKIDFNGFTVQSTYSSLPTFSIQGANVIFSDSKVNFKKGDEEYGEKPSVHSYGASAIDVLSGSLTINSGAYLGRSDGRNNPYGIRVDGGTCVINDGIIIGDYVGASCSNGGNLYINGGYFETSYLFAIMDSGQGNIKIAQGEFVNIKSYKPTYVLGAYNNSNNEYSFDKWLLTFSPSGYSSHFSCDVNTRYWTGTNNNVSLSPTNTNNEDAEIYPYAVSYLGNCSNESEKINVILDEYNNFQYRLSSDGSISITGYTGYDTELIIPSEINGYKVTCIEELEFNTLTKITIPDSITTIGEAAFKDCTNLSNIEIPKSVTKISKYAFYGCTSLTRITIPNSVKSIGSYTFYGCKNLKSIDIPNTVTNIGSYSFSECTSLENIKLPSTISTIKYHTFYGCTNLKNITIPDNVTSIGASAFSGCTNFTSITIPDNVTSIGNSAFYGCTGLENIIIPKNNKNIGNKAFWNCSNLKSITFLNPECDIYSAYETISGSATIYGYANSTAQSYAGNFNRKFVEIKSADDPIIPTQITDPNPTEPTTKNQINVEPVIKKKANNIKVTAKTKTVKIKKLKFKKQTVKPLTITNAKGKVMVTLIKKGTAPKIYKKIKVNQKGVVTLKKGKYTKGKYKIKLSIKASGNSAYNAKTITKTVTIKIK